VPARVDAPMTANRAGASFVLSERMRSVLLMAAALALAGCGGGNESSSPQTGGGSSQQAVSISETEFSLDPSTVEIGGAGKVTFEVENRGQVAHALEVEGNGVEEETAEIQPGESATLSVELSKPGSYEMYCPIDGHDDKGMKGSIRVGGSAGGGTSTGGQTTTDDDPGY
jgi:uncharacterized cupredoxin-like copper-binding protein